MALHSWDMSLTPHGARFSDLRSYIVQRFGGQNSGPAVYVIF